LDEAVALAARVAGLTTPGTTPPLTQPSNSHSHGYNGGNGHEHGHANGHGHNSPQRNLCPTIVLLSPGGTSYDAYRDFEERGEHFRRLVNTWNMTQEQTAPLLVASQ